MAFIFKKTLRANAGRVEEQYTIGDSITVSVGMAVMLSSGVLVIATAGSAVAGIITGLRKADGSPLTDNGAGGKFVGSYTTGSSNTVVAVIDKSKESIYSVPLDAAAATTSGSQYDGANFDVLSGGLLLDESTIAAAGSTATFCRHKVDPNTSAPANSILVSIQESQFDI